MRHRIIVLWTVPRSVSTSFERMMSARGDHAVFDEPFSRSYYFGPDRRSSRYTDSLPDSSAEEVLATIEEAALERPVFVKDMAYQAAELLDADLLGRFENCFLVRHPSATLRSLNRHWPDFTDDESGWGHLDEAARIDGCSRWQAALRVVVPAARGGIASAAILGAVTSWSQFAVPFILLDDPDLFRRYGEYIPVVFVDGRQHEFWRVSPERLRAALRAS